MSSLSHAAAESAAAAAAALEPISSVTTAAVVASAEAAVAKVAAPLAFSSVRRYRQVTLTNNGLRVLLVSDKSKLFAATSQQQVALTIHGAGQFADPNDLPGCAHLMEQLCLCSTTSSISAAYSSLLPL
jgi:insulysin